MNVKQIADKFGLPARVRIPLVKEVGVDFYGKSFTHVEYIYRTITKKLENGHYLQYDESQPWHGEFQCCFTEGFSERIHGDWEYAGKPTLDQLPKPGEENGWNERKNLDSPASGNA
jgi:hypothetical protein